MSSNLFKKGQSGNPDGRPKLPEHIREARLMNAIECQEIMNDLIQLPREEIEEIAENPKTSVFRAMLARIMVEAIKCGDQTRLNFILDRLIGKVADSTVIRAQIELAFCDYTSNK